MNLVLKILFLPLSVGGGIVAGILGKKAFELSWSLVDKEEPPEPEYRHMEIWKLVAALALEGAIFRLARGLVDHFTREFFARATGSWPGDEEPENA